MITDWGVGISSTSLTTTMSFGEADAEKAEERRNDIRRLETKWKESMWKQQSERVGHTEAKHTGNIRE
eukprot:753501-Hanusia_phi.AAC.5